MLKVTNYREKNKLLIICALLFGLISYFFSLSSTFELFEANRTLETRLASARTAPVTISRLSGELEKYEGILRGFSASGGNWEERLLQQVSSTCQQHHVTLLTLPSSIVEEHNGFRIYTRTVKVEGGFISLLQVLHALEETEAIGRVSSVKFALEEDRKTKKAFLVSNIYIQHIERKEDYEQ